MFWIAALIGAAIGQIGGLLGTRTELSREHERLGDQKKSAWDQYLLGKEHADREFGIQQDEARYQLGQQESALHEGVGRFTDDYNTMMLARAYGAQDARIQAASGIGASLAAEGASGTRGNAAAALARAYAGQSLERNLDVQRRQDESALAGTLGEANRALGGIRHERESWEKGGWRWEQKAAQDKYNLDLANLQQSDFQSQMDKVNPSLSNWENNGWDYLTAFFSGAAAGIKGADTVYNYDWNWGGGGGK